MRACVPPTNPARHPTLRGVLCAGIAAFALVGCSDVVSLAPAVTNEEAIELPALVGRWRVVDTLTGGMDQSDTSRVEVQRREGPTPNYLIEYWNFSAPDSGQVAEPVRPRMFNARVGRVGGSLLLELRPSKEADTLLAAVDRTYDPALQATYQTFRIEVDSTTFRVLLFEADSVQEAVRDGRCPGPFFVDPDSSNHMVLTGSSEQVLAIWACVSTLPGIMRTDSIVLRRAPH